MKKPLVSVVSMSMNSSQFIEETISSVRKQTYNNIEHIIIDGGSTDGTLKIIDSYKEVICVSEKETSDFPAFEASWKGFRKAKGEFIIWLCISDNLHDENWVATAVQELESDRNASWCWGLSQAFTEDGCLGKVYESQFLEMIPPQKEDFFYYWLVSGFGVECNAVFRKNIFIKCMPELNCKIWRKHPTLGLNFNLNAMGYQCISLPIICYHGRIHDGQLNQTRKKDMDEVSIRYNILRKRFFLKTLFSKEHVFLSPKNSKIHSVKRSVLILNYLKYKFYFRLIKSFRKISRKILNEY